MYFMNLGSESLAYKMAAGEWLHKLVKLEMDDSAVKPQQKRSN